MTKTEGTGGAPVHVRDRLIVALDQPELKTALAHVDLGPGSVYAANMAAGAVDLAGWFSRLDLVADDFTATSAVLYGQDDAALVAEHNPLLGAHLGQDLKTLFTSPPLSLPLLAVREAALTADQRRSLDDAMRGLAGDPRGRKLLEALKADGFAGLSAAEAAGVTALPSAGAKEPEIALPSAAGLTLTPAPLPAAAQLPFLLAVELPDVPLPREDDSGGHGER